jgi:hypothetical protein
LRVVVSKDGGGKMVHYSKFWHEFLEVAEGFGVVTLGLTLLVVLVAVAAPYPSNRDRTRFPTPWSIEDIGACFVVKDRPAKSSPTSITRRRRVCATFLIRFTGLVNRL